MNEFEELLNSVSEVNTGDVVTAEVISVDNDQANVVIEGTGIEGVLTRRELTNDRDANVADLVKDGETLEVLVLRQVVGKDTDTVTYLVSKKRLEARKAWDKLVGREEEVVTVKGTRAVKGGLSVEFEGLRGFIPASMIDTRFVRNTEQFVGQEFDAKIKEVDPAENRFILSRREVVEAEAAEARKEVFSKLEVGSVVTGKVARLTSFGAFIDLGGVDGLVHVTELSHERNVSPKSVVSVGDEVEVKVLAIDEEAGRVSLSLKATTPGPWDGVEQKLAAGDVVEGTVMRFTEYGAFVDIGLHEDGLADVADALGGQSSPERALQIMKDSRVGNYAVLAMVLALLTKEDTYGYQITKDIQEHFAVSESTLYPVLRRLQKDGCLTIYDEPFNGRNRRYYKITPLGRQQLAGYKAEWKVYAANIDHIFGEDAK